MPSTSTATRPTRRFGVDAAHDHYKWWALSCTSVGMLLATINSGTLIIALPDLERSLHTSLLTLVWVILVYMIASTVLVLSAGRLSDQFGRKNAYIGGVLRFAAASLGGGLSTWSWGGRSLISPGTGSSGSTCRLGWPAASGPSRSCVRSPGVGRTRLST